MVRRMITYNRRTLYRTKCSLCGKEIFSVYSSDKPVKVFCNKCWWSDKWDSLDYGMELDFSVPFLEQLSKLIFKVPTMALYVDSPTMVNSEYSSAAAHLKNCYLVFHADFAEDSGYCDTISSSKDCFDSTMVSESQLCYGSINVQKCYRTYFSIDCENSYDLYFSKNMVGCSNCFGCTNLRNKQYYIFNKPYIKEEYFENLKKFDLGSYAQFLNFEKQASDFWQAFPLKFMHGRHNVNVTGDYIEYSKNTFHSFQSAMVEDSKYCSIVYLKPTKDSYDYTSWGNNASQIYDSQGVGENVSRIKFSHSCWPNCTDLEH